MTSNIYKLNDFVAEKVLLKQKELDKYCKLFSPKRSVREIIRKYQEAAECVPDSNTGITQGQEHCLKVHTPEEMPVKMTFHCFFF